MPRGVMPARLDSLSEHVVPGPLIFFVSEEQFDQAVETRLESNRKRCFPELGWNLQSPA